jgi:hypothetical protein
MQCGIPVSGEVTTLCYFMAYLANQGFAPKMRKAYLSAVRSMQISRQLAIHMAECCKMLADEGEDSDSDREPHVWW